MRRSGNGQRPLGRLALGAILVLLGVYAGLYVGFAAALVAYPFEIDQGEGYDVWSAWLVAQGMPTSARAIT